MQGNDEYNMDGIDEDLWQHIEAQLRDAKKPVLGNRKWTVLHRAAARGLAEVVGRLLVACPFLIDEQCDDGTALHVAAANGHTAIVAQLLVVDPILAEARTNDGSTALHRAASRGQAAIVTQLLAVNPGLVGARTSDGQTILHCAVGSAVIVRQLLAVEPTLAEATTSSGETALHIAAREGHTATVTQLLATNPALINARADHGRTALHEAAGLGHSTIVAQLLALNPALADARAYDDDWTALHAAAQNGHAAAMTQLLAADPSSINERASGQTAIHHATAWGHAALVAQLLAAKASTELSEQPGGRTVLHEAVSKGHSEIVSQFLAANPALIDARTNDGLTVLHCARHDAITAQLLAARPTLLDEIIDDVNSGTALLNAVQLGQEEAAIRLLTIHPNMTYEALNDLCGWTVFHYAAYFAREKVMSWLLSAVSEPDREQVLLRRSTRWYFDVNKDVTALHLAAMRGHRNIVAQLLAACPSLIDVLNYNDWAELLGSTINILLEFKPALVHAVDRLGNTLLHSIMLRIFSKELIERVWKMNPDALHTANPAGETPFHLAVTTDNDIAIDSLQWGLTFAEIAKVFSHYEKSVEKFKPLMQLQCRELAVELLPGLVDIVFEYLGFRKGTKNT